jgi:hypothetical protein
MAPLIPMPRRAAEKFLTLQPERSPKPLPLLMQQQLIAQ